MGTHQFDYTYFQHISKNQKAGDYSYLIKEDKTDTDTKLSRKWKMFAMLLFGFVGAIVFLSTVVLPIVFMFDLKLQRLLVFMNVNAPTNQDYYENFNLTGFRNLYVPVERTSDETVYLGVWHVVPRDLMNETIRNKNFDYDEALRHSKYNVIMNFHGAGEVRSDFTNKTALFRNSSFHVINFDYRSFADSTRATLSEEAVASDCVNLYKWLRTRTNASIFIWGHSLGTAIASKTVNLLEQENIKPSGLVLESAFTSLRDELPVHPFGQMFAWLPWFKATILNPLSNNNFIFDTIQYVSNITCPIMVLHAKDDSIVPYQFGEKVYNTVRARNIPNNIAKYYLFPANLTYDHFYIYTDENLPRYIQNFVNLSLGNTSN